MPTKVGEVGGGAVRSLLASKTLKSVSTSGLSIRGMLHIQGIWNVSLCVLLWFYTFTNVLSAFDQSATSHATNLHNAFVHNLCRIQYKTPGFLVLENIVFGQSVLRLNLIYSRLAV